MQNGSNRSAAPDTRSHNHACVIFDDLASYRKVAFRYIHEGLCCGEKCIMAVDSYSPSMIAADFAAHGLQMDAFINRGALTIIDVQSSYSAAGGFEPARTIEMWQNRTRQALDQGYGALRVVGEATFALGEPDLADKLVLYENTMNEVLFPHFPFKSLCAYDKSLYPPRIIKAAIKAHPTLFYNEELFAENIHYVPPEIHFRSEKERDEIDVWLENVKRNNENIRALREREEAYRVLVENAGDAVYIAQDGLVKYANRKSEEISGYTIEELTSHPIADFIHPDDREKVVDHHLRRLKGHDIPSTYPFKLLHKSGELKHVELNSVVTLWKGAPATLNYLRDITDRKKAEARLGWNARRNELLSDMAAGLLSSSDSERLVGDLCRKVMVFLDCQAFFNFMADETSGRLRLNAYAGIPEEEARKIGWLDYGVSVCGCVADDCIRRIVEEIELSDDINTALVKSYGIRAYCCHPLMVEDRLIGTLSFGTRTRSKFIPEEIEVMATVTHLVASAMNRIAAERELRERERRFRDIFEGTGDAIYIHDMSGRILEANAVAVAQLGYSREELLQLSPAAIDSEGHADKVAERMRTVRDTGSFVFETAHRRKDDREFPVEVHSRLIHYQGLACMLSIARDITERKRLEADRIQTAMELIQRNQFIETVLDNLPIGLAVNYIDEGRATYINKEFEAIYGWPKEEIQDITQFFQKVYPDPAYRQEIQQRVMADIQSGDPHRMVWDGFEITTKKGEHRTIWAKNIPLFEQNLMISTVQDVTESKKLQERLQQAQKMEAIGSLAGGIAHDFNNILFPILGMSEMLIDDLPEGSFQKEAVGQIITAGKRGSELVKQILAFGRQTGHEMLPLRIQKIMREVMQLSRASIPTSIDIVEDIQADCAPVLANPTQIHQIAMNLITNAYHAIGADTGKISIALNETSIGANESPGNTLDPGRYLCLAVSDTGCGIDPSDMNKIFEPYFTTKAQGKGTGLGLAVVFGIVKEHRGEISVHSEPGTGTTFTVYLPVIQDHSERKRTASAAVSKTGTERILLVDDEPAIVTMEKKMLERLGYQVTVRTDSVDALSLFRANPRAFDLVITDMTMPNMTGDFLAEEMMAVRPDLPIIVCTGFSEKMDADRADAMGVKGLLMKPVAKFDMAELVRNVLDEAKN